MKASEFKNRGLELFLNSLPKDWQTIGEFEPKKDIPETDKSIYICKISKEWKIPGVHFPFTDQRITIKTTRDTEKTTVTLSGKFSSLTYQGEISQKGAVQLETENPKKDSPILNLITKSTGMDPVTDWMTFFPTKLVLNEMVGLVPTPSGMIGHHQLKAELKETYHVPGTSLEFSDPTLQVDWSTPLENSAHIPSISGRIHAQFKAIKTASVEIRLSSNDIATVILEGAGGKALPGPADLLKSVGFEKVGNDLTELLNQAPLIGDLEVERLRVNFNTRTKKFLRGDLAGSTILAEHKVRFLFAYPQPRLAVHLDPKTPIEVMNLIKKEEQFHKLFPDLGGVPSNLTIDKASLEVGYDPFHFDMGLGLKEIWKADLGGVKIDFQRLQIGFSYTSEKPLSGSLGATILLGEVDFRLLAERVVKEKKTGWHFRSAIAEQQAIPLSEIIKDLAKLFGLDEPKHLPEIDVRHVLIDFNTLDKTFEFKASAEIKEKLGWFDTTEVDLHIKVDKKNDKKPLQINLNGKITIGGSYLEFHTDLGHKDWSLDVHWEKGKSEGLSLTKIIQTADAKQTKAIASIPKEVEAQLTLTKLGFSYHHASKALELSAENNAGIGVKLNVSRSDGNAFAVVFGIHYDSRANAIPVVGDALHKMEKDIELIDGWLLINWVPEDYKKTSEGFGKDWPVPVEKMGKGITLVGNLAIKTTAKGGFANLNNALPSGKGTLAIIGAIDFVKKSLQLGIKWKGELTFKNKDATKDALIVRDCGIKIQISPSRFGIEASGEIHFLLEEYLVKSRVALELTNENIMLKGYAEVDGGIPFFGIKEVEIHSLGLMVGVGFTPPSFQIGVTGELAFRKKELKPGERVPIKEYFGVQLGFTSPIPVPQYVAIDISKISLNDILENLQDNGTKGRRILPEKMAEIKALSFVYAAKKIGLPDGTEVLPGVAFNGLFTINNWNAWLEFSAKPSKGFAAFGQFEKINVPGLSVTGNTKDLKRLHVKNGNEWIPVSNTKRLDKDAVTEERVMLKGGGALLRASTFESPYIKADFDIKILDISEFKVDIEVNDKGMACKVIAHIPGLYDLDHTATIKPPEILQTKGSFTAGPNVELPFSLNPPFTGKQKVGLFITGHQDIQTGSDTAFHFHFDYHFEIIGKTIPGIDIDVPHPPHSFEDVLDMVMKNFWKNAVVNICKLVVPDFFHFVCDALNVFKSSKQSGTKTFWMEKAMNIAHDENQPLLRVGRASNPLKELADEAKKENKEEIKLLDSISDYLAEDTEEMVQKGRKRLKGEIDKMKREIKDLEDKNHSLENTLKNIWEETLPDYSYAKAEFLTAEQEHLHQGKGKKRLKDARKKLDQIIGKIRKEEEKITARWDDEKGYEKGKKKWTAASIAHFSEIAEMHAETYAIKRYRAALLLEDHQAHFFAKKKKQTPKVIDITLKPINE